MDYLEFIDLNEFDGNMNIVDVLPDSIEQQNNANYLSAPIGVRAGIPIGARDQLTNFIFVSAGCEISRVGGHIFTSCRRVKIIARE